MRSAPKRSWPCRNGSVGGEDHFACHHGCCLIETDALVDHPCTNGFKHGKDAVPFVHVIHAGRNAHGAQRAHATHAQQ